MRCLMLWSCLGWAVASHAAEPLQRFEIRDHLNRRWTDELVHFCFDIPGASSDLQLTDERGATVPCQRSDVVVDPAGQRVRGSLWTVVSLEPGQRKTFCLVPGTAAAEFPGAVSVAKEDGAIVVANDRVAVRLPDWSGRAKPGQTLAQLPAPLTGIRSAKGVWLCGAEWFNDGPPLALAEAKTEIVERGPLRVAVRQRFTLAGGQTYEMLIQLTAQQDAVLVTEHTTIDQPQAGFRLSMQPGLNADHVFWNNQWKETSHAKSYALTDTAVDFRQADTLCKLRPWSFWWLGDLTMWAGFYRKADEKTGTGTDRPDRSQSPFSRPLVGVLALRPSRWSPGDWGGFDRTEIPVTTGPGPRLDLTFSLLALIEKSADGSPRVSPLHREWALTAGSVGDHVPEPPADAKSPPTPKLRRQLIKYSEFPLDEVKDYGFDFPATNANREHPFLLITRDDVQRVRRQARTVPVYQQTVAAARHYILHAAGGDRTLQKEGWQAFYRKNYIGNYFIEKLPEAYLGSDDPIFGQMLAAAVKGLAQESLDTFLESPTRPALGAYGPWFSETWMRLVLNYDLIAGTGLLTPDEEAAVRAALVFGAHQLAHPDYWNTAHGLASANPNMTNSIVLPRGMLALFLAGHTDAAVWLRDAEEELKSELKGWVSPGGAWVENPGYQAASLDSLMLLSQAIRNVQGRDYFADPQLRATLDYYGFILTPPDKRFPPVAAGSAVAPTAPSAPAPATLPAIGDGFAGLITCFPGWMAKATAASDPAYSARQQFYWKSENFYLGSAGRAKGFAMALVDPELTATPPAETARAFPGFGSVLRTSWTDPLASYVALRTGPNVHHYHDDFGSFVYYAKGAPLCLDFGNCYQPVQRGEPWYHNRVSFDKGDSPKRTGSTGQIVEVRHLPGAVSYSRGKTSGGGGQQNDRHVLLVPSENPLGANYLLVRDHAFRGQPGQNFYWNLWCLADEPSVTGSLVHFPGQLGVDLDVHLVSPANAPLEKDQWAWEQHIYVWGPFRERQHGIRLTKQEQDADFLALLYPRAAGQSAAKVVALAGGAAIRVEHLEGTDHVLVSPDKPAQVMDGTVQLHGELALARRYTDGGIRLAVLKGEPAVAQLDDWSVQSTRPVALTVRGREVRGVTSGDGGQLVIRLPADWPQVVVTVDGQAVVANRDDRVLTVPVPRGEHTFEIRR